MNVMKPPTRWQIVELSDVCRVINGFAFNSAKFSEHQGMPLIRIRDLKTHVPSLRYDGEYDPTFLVPTESLLVGMDGEFRCYKWLGEPALLNQRVCRLIPDESYLVSEFLFYVLNDYLIEIERQTAYTTVKHLSSSQILKIAIPLPSVSEQRRIAALIDAHMQEVERARVAVQAQIDAAEQLMSAYLCEVFESEEAQRWEKKPFGTVAKITSKIVDPTLPEFGQLPHVSGENIESGTGNLRYLNTAYEDGMTSPKYFFEPGDVLYSKLRPYLRKVMYVDFEGLCSADMYPIKVDPEQLDARFTVWLLLAEEFTVYANEQSRRARMPKLNREQLFAWEAPVPPLTIQKTVADELRQKQRAIDDMNCALYGQLAEISQLPAAILRQAFSGEL